MSNNGHPPLPLFPETSFGDGEYAELQMRLDLFEDMIVATRYERDMYGKGPVMESTFVVDPLDLAAKLGGLDINTGLLPPGCLFWQRRNGSERLGVYIAPQVWPLSVVPTDKPNRVIPLPGMVLVGQGRGYALYAVIDEQPTGKSELYHAPVPNVSGAVCQGNVDFPSAGAATIWQAVQAFFESGFNNHLPNGKSKKYPDNILAMWRVLNRAKATEYPLDDLVSTGLSLQEVINGHGNSRG